MAISRCATWVSVPDLLACRGLALGVVAGSVRDMRVLALFLLWLGGRLPCLPPKMVF